MNLWFKTILYLLVIAGTGALLITRWIPLPWVGLGLISIPLGFVSDLKGSYLLKPGINRILLALGILLAFGDYFWVSHHPFITVMDLMIYLVAIRVLSPKANRDLIQIIALSFFCLLGSAALTTDLLYALFFLTFSCLLPWGLLMVSLKAELEGERDMLRGKVAERHPLTLPPGFSRFLSKGLALRMVFAIGTTLLMTFLFFTLFPRFTIGQLAGKLSLREPLSGFTPEIRLGDLGKILEDPTPVARVQVDKHSGDELYLRGITLNRFDGTTWKRTLYQRQRLYSSEGRFLLEENPPHDRIRATIYLEDTGTKILFAIPQTIRIALPSSFLVVEEDGVLSAPYMTFPYRYEVEFSKDYFRSYPWEKLSLPLDIPEPLTHYLELPPRELLPEPILAHTKEQNGSFIPQLLSEFARFRYTLDLSPSPTPLHTFFQKKEGHCELFATALALILRSAGIPTRIVSGFRGGEWIPEKGYYLVRQRNAHSWVEAWIPDYGWIPLDPTPPAPLPGGFLLHLEEGMQRALEWLRFFWLEYVVEYNLRSQKELIRESHKTFLEWRERVRSELRFKKLRTLAQKNIPWIVLALGLLVAFLFLFPAIKPFSIKPRKENPILPILFALEKRYGSKPPALPFNLWAESHLPRGLKERFRTLYQEYSTLYYRSSGLHKTSKDKGLQELSRKIKAFLSAFKNEENDHLRV